MNKSVLKVLGAIGIFIVSAGLALLVTSLVHPAESSKDSDTAMVKETPTPTETTTPTTTSDSEATAAKARQQDILVKNMLESISSGLANYTANNRGTIPNTDAMLEEFKTKYLSDVDLTNPTTTTNYELLLNPPAPTSSIIAYKPSFACSLDDTSAAPVTGKGRQYALNVILPSGKSYCIGS
ncbi:MAG: hypothetical protein ACOH18_05205 [Candidatus Saccharimonadaceae bacterium]